MTAMTGRRTGRCATTSGQRKAGKKRRVIRPTERQFQDLPATQRLLTDIPGVWVRT